MTEEERQLADEARRLYKPGVCGYRSVAYQLGVSQHFVRVAIGSKPGFGRLPKKLEERPTVDPNKPNLTLTEREALENPVLVQKIREMHVPRKVGARTIAKQLRVSRHFVEVAVGEYHKREKEQKHKKRVERAESSETVVEREIQYQKDATRSEVCWYARGFVPDHVPTLRERIESLFNESNKWWWKRRGWSLKRWYMELTRGELA